MPKRCLRKGNVDTSRARQGLAQYSAQAQAQHHQHQYHSRPPDQLARTPSLTPISTHFVAYNSTPKKSGGRRQTAISPLRGSIPRHPGQRSSTENTADCVATGSNHRTCRWLHGRSQVRKKENISVPCPRARALPIRSLPWSLGWSGWAGEDRVVVLPVCPLKRDLVSLTLPELASP